MNSKINGWQLTTWKPPDITLKTAYINWQLTTDDLKTHCNIN